MRIVRNNVILVEYPEKKCPADDNNAKHSSDGCRLICDLFQLSYKDSKVIEDCDSVEEF